MAMRTAEFEPCIEESDTISPQDRRELERQKSLLRNVFTRPQYLGDSKRASILVELQLKVKRICRGEETLEEFSAFRDSVANTTDYAFLGERHPGLNKTGWGILLAEIAPLEYGRDLKRVVEKEVY